MKMVFVARSVAWMADFGESSNVVNSHDALSRGECSRTRHMDCVRSRSEHDARERGLGGIGGEWVELFPSISADGQIVAFYSSAYNLVSGDTNGCD